MKKIIFISIIIVISGLTFFTFFGDNQLESKSLTMFVTDWAPYGFAYVAQEKGFFESNDLNVELILLDETQSLISFPRGFTADGSMEVLADAITISSNNIPSQLVYVVDESGDADVIISKYSSIKELKGKTIGIWEFGGFSRLFAVSLLEQNGLTAEDVTFVEIDPDEIVNQLNLGNIDAGHTFNQYNIQKAKDFGYSVIATERDTPGLIVDGIMFKNSFIQKNPDSVLKFVKSFSEAQEYCKFKPDECAKIIAIAFDWKKSDVIIGLEDVDLLSFDDNVDLFLNPHSSLYESGRFIINQLQKDGYISYPHDIETIINSEFINKLSTN